MGLPRKLDVLVSLFARHANTEDELTAFGPGILLGKAAPRWWRRVVVVVTTCDMHNMHMHMHMHMHMCMHM